MDRFLLVLGAIVVVLLAAFAAAGWITFHKTPEKATIEIETREMQQAGERTVEKSRQLVEEAADSVKKAVHEEQPASTAKDSTKKSDDIPTSVPSTTITPN
jgi:Flp pilus assembly protein TadB